MKQAFAMVILIVFALPLLVICQTKNGENKTESEVKKVDEEFHKAFMLEDAAALENLLTDNFIWTHSTGNIQTKAVILTNVKSGKLQYEIADTDDVQISMYKNAAVVSGHATRRYPGKDTFWLRYTTVYVKIGRKWKAAAFHSSHVPK